jgi:hypothetical protein
MEARDSIKAIRIIQVTDVRSLPKLMTRNWREVNMKALE